MAKEKLDNYKVNEVEAQASSTVSIKPGTRVVNGGKMLFSSGKAKISAKNRSANAVLGVHIMETAYLDEPIKEWFLQPGESISYSSLGVQKDYLYLRLSSYSQNATGTGTLSTV